MNIEMNVGKLKKALRRFDDEEKVSIFLSILDDDSDYIFGRGFDVDRWQRNGLALELLISIKYADLEEIFKYTQELLEEKKEKEKSGKKKSRIKQLYESMKRAEIMLISFDEACECLKEKDYFFIVFNGLDDESDTYASILVQHPWIANEFVTPDEISRHLVLIKKTTESKDWLIHYPRELNNRIIIDVEKWDELIAVAFNRNQKLIERTVKDNERIGMVNFFKEHPQDVLQRLELK